MKPSTACKGGGKTWSVNKDGKPVCPGCHRAFSTVAGYGKTVRDMPTVPPHPRPGRHDALKFRRVRPAE